MELNEVRVFHVDTEFIVAADEDSAVKFYREIGDDLPPEDVDEVPRDKWPTMKIVDIDEVGHPEHTFQESIEDMLTWSNQEYPKILASSEY